MSEWKTRITKVRAVGSQREQRATGEACLVLIYPPGPDMGKRFPLDRAEMILGRGAEADIQVDRDSVSRKHAKVYRTGARTDPTPHGGGDHIDAEWIVEDLGSTNGSYVNDQPIYSGQTGGLQDGDFLKIGAAIFKFLIGANVEVSYYEEIYRMTIVDGLTGVHNKRFFLEFLDREIARCARYSRPLSLVMFDIDHFKKINDDHGHLTGDHVLRELAKRLHNRIRREELLARYGGEEFAAVLPETNLAGALEFGEQIRMIVAKDPFEFEGDKLTVTISVGVATTDGTTIDVGTFVKAADENLYKAKRGGRNMVVG
jgi:diguanylate cyclase (GGDEF)-like protein